MNDTERCQECGHAIYSVGSHLDAVEADRVLKLSVMVSEVTLRSAVYRKVCAARIARDIARQLEDWPREMGLMPEESDA